MPRPSRSPLGALALLATSMAGLASCGGETIEPDPRCVTTRMLAFDVDMMTRSGRVLQYRLNGWDIGQLEADDTITPIATLSFNQPISASAWLDHDPVSGRMWLLVGRDDDLGSPAQLHQFDADGELEWTQALTAARPVLGGTVRYHEDALYLALTLDQFEPADPNDWDAYIPRTLTLERRDLAGQVVWTHTGIARGDEPNGFASAQLIHVSGSALAMVATPDLIDYGPSYPLTVDIETGAVLWSGAADGHDPLRMVADDERLYLAWTLSVFDTDVSTSTLSVRTPSDGVETAHSEVEWRPPWASGWAEGNIVLGWMGEQLVSVVADTQQPSVTVHAKDGVLTCQATLDAAFDSVGAGYAIEGRPQFFVSVGLVIGAPADPQYERALLVIEPLADE